MNITKLQNKLDRAKTKYTRLINKVYPTDAISEYFHLGTVGGSGKPVQKLNRQRERVLDQRIDDAKEIVRLGRYIAELEWRIKNADKIAKKPKVVKVKVSRPRKAKPTPTGEYLSWANALCEAMETRIQAARSRMHGVQWDNNHDHFLRGEIAAYIEVQAVLVSEHFRGNSVTKAQLQNALSALVEKRENELKQSPTSRYLPEYCKGLRLGVETVQEAL